MMYGFKTAPELTSTRVGGMMKEVEEELNRVIKVGQLFIGQKVKVCFYVAHVSRPVDRSKRSTQTCSFRHQLDFYGKHSSHAAITRRLFTHISTTVYSQVLIYTTV